MQRWSARRVGLWAAVLLLPVLAANPTNYLDSRVAVRTPLRTSNLDCTHSEPLWLEAQSVPSASLLPCVRTRLPGWKVADVAVNDGRTEVVLDHDRAGEKAVVARLTASCDLAGTVEVPPQEPGTRRYERVESLAGAYSASWYDQFPGGCVSYRLHSTSDPEGRFATELPSLLGFATRDALRQELEQRSGGRLHLDPGEAR